jgi:hypothetical protein
VLCFRVGHSESYVKVTCLLGNFENIIHFSSKLIPRSKTPLEIKDKVVHSSDKLKRIFVTGSEDRVDISFSHPSSVKISHPKAPMEYLNVPEKSIQKSKSGSLNVVSNISETDNSGKTKVLSTIDPNTEANIGDLKDKLRNDLKNSINPKSTYSV